MTVQAYAPLFVAVGVAILSGIIDVLYFKVPNRITVPFAVSGLIFHGVTGGLVGLGHSAAGCLTCFIVLVLLYMMGAMSAGDVKFMCGVGAWLGVDLALYVFLVAAIVSAVYSAVLLVSQGGLARLMSVSHTVLFQLYRAQIVARHIAGVESVEAIVKTRDRRRLVPFAAMLATGVLVIVVCKFFFPTYVP